MVSQLAILWAARYPIFEAKYVFGDCDREPSERFRVTLNLDDSVTIFDSLDGVQLRFSAYQVMDKTFDLPGEIDQGYAMRCFIQEWNENLSMLDTDEGEART
jgi:hypothetical protein